MEDKKINLSSEDINKLSRTISEAKDLAVLQEEILANVLALEKKISVERITALDKYFDTYFSRLDEVATKSSKLADSYLLINKLATTTQDSSTDKTGKNTQASSKSTSQSNNNGRVVKVSNNIADSQAEALNTEGLLDVRDKVNNITEDIGKLTSELDEAVKLADKGFEKDKKYLETNSELKEKLDKKEIARIKKQLDLADDLKEKELELAGIRTASIDDYKNELRLSEQLAAKGRETDAADAAKSREAQISYWESAESGAIRAKQVNAEGNLALNEEIKTRLEEERKFLEASARAKNGGQLSEKDAAAINKQIAERAKAEEKSFNELSEKKAKKELELLQRSRLEKERDDSRAAQSDREWERNFREEEKNYQRGRAAAGEAAMSTVFGNGVKTRDRIDAFKDLTTDPETGKTSAKAVAAFAAKAVSNLAKALENTIDEIASYKGPIDTRLYGSKHEKSLLSDSYWDKIVDNMTSVGAINPFFKQADFAKNIKELVDSGIAFDLEQRAFLMTIKDKIATTFNVADSTLLRLIRLQQEDSTAGRLGMEASLNAFLNNMYENTEYLKGVADSVRGSLQEMEALMAGAEATEVEYQVQKWLGSLYSVGMSQEATTSIANTLGQIAAGQIEGLTSGGAGNLLIMAANNAGIPIADILTNGITSEDTNSLLEAVVKYLAEISESTKDNQVVQQQLASVFGVMASDLRAAANLVLPGTINDITSKSMSYGDMMSTLYDMAGSMGSRTSIAEMMTNFWENGQYTLAGGMASNPVSYFIYKMAKVVDDAAGGIDLPFLNVMGFGVDLNTTVSDLMRVAAVGAGILGSIGPMISGLGSSFSGKAMLDKLGIGKDNGLAITPRGSLSAIANNGGGSKTTSGSAYAGNALGSDIKDSTVQEAEDSKKQQMIEAKEEEGPNQVDELNITVVKIYELLDAVASGKSAFSVKVDSYGLTRSGNTSNSNALGGVEALSGTTAGSRNSGNSVISGGGGNGIDTGGWVMV